MNRIASFCLGHYSDRVKRIWYLSPMRAAKVQASLRIGAVSPEPSLLAHTSSESRGTFRQKARSLAPLNVWACAVKICHGGMLEDTDLLDGAHSLSNMNVHLADWSGVLLITLDHALSSCCLLNPYWWEYLSHVVRKPALCHIRTTEVLLAAIYWSQNSQDSGPLYKVGGFLWVHTLCLPRNMMTISKCQHLWSLLPRIHYATLTPRQIGLWMGLQMQFATNSQWSQGDRQTFVGVCKH